jgi:hypothetical protein
MLFIVAGGAGHGHGDNASLAAALWFGYGAPLWFVLPPLQYTAYAYAAFRRNRRLGFVLAAAHYLGAATLLLVGTGGERPHLVADGGWAEATFLFGPFLLLNVAYFTRLLRR